MQLRAATTSVSLLASALLALSGNTAQADVAPSGKDSAAGTQSDPTTLTSAISRITSGGKIQ